MNLQLEGGLGFDGTLTLSSNKYKEYLIDSVHIDPARSGQFADLKDKKMSGVPEVFYNLAVRYTPPVLQSAYAMVSIQGVGEYYADDRNQYKVPSRTILHATIGVDHLHISESGFFIRGVCGNK